MDEVGRRSKGVTKPPNRSSLTVSPSPRMMYERRPLKTITLSAPDYKIPTQMLTDSYIEKEVRFAGVVPSIPIDLDCTNRTDVLRVIDRGKQERLLPWSSSYDQDAIFMLDAKNVKISHRDGNEEILLRLPIHEMAATCYIRDGDQHIIAIKYGGLRISHGQALTDSSDLCNLAVLCCDNKESAEELCSLIGQCFQLVYTDATMRFLDMKLSEVAAGLSTGSSTQKSDISSANSTPKRERADHNLQCLTQSVSDLNQVNGSYSSFMSRSLTRTMATRRSSTARSESELSTTANIMIQDYMNKLYTKLNKDELGRFAMLVKAWHTNMSFSDFCSEVLELYGPERKYLLQGMKPFIPERDLPLFDTFLEKVGANNDTISGNSRIFRSSVGGHSFITSTMTPGASDEYDRMLNDISRSIENLGTSIEMHHVPSSENDTVPKTT